MLSHAATVCKGVTTKHKNGSIAVPANSYCAKSRHIPSAIKRALTLSSPSNGAGAHPQESINSIKGGEKINIAR